ncbi:MAG: DUF72 domain-containing protein [Candidatus Binatia bacterium]|nr:DUF72 domain-containing protein [Candidatus Binatia bacterium]
MHFGRVSSPEGIHFDPVPSDPRTIGVLGGRPTAHPQLFIGAPIWGVPGWVGEVYPPRTPAKQFLRHYAHRFPTVELNPTFYTIPPAARLEAWRDTVPDGFRFCPKVPRDASHARPGKQRDDALTAFSEALDILGTSAPLPFLQLPAEIAPMSRAQIRNMIDRLPERHRPAIEFRHHGWFHDQRLDDETFAWMQDTNLAVVVTDVAGRRDVLHGSLPSRRVVVRFGGNRLHETDYQRIRSWAETLTNWFELGLEEAYFFVHQPEDEFTPRLISVLEEEIRDRAPELLPPLPHLLPEPSGDGQLSLL